MTAIDLLLIAAALGTLGTAGRSSGTKPVSLSLYFLPAVAIMCTAISLGPAHGAEVATALAVEYDDVGIHTDGIRIPVTPRASSSSLHTKKPVAIDGS